MAPPAVAAAPAQTRAIIAPWFDAIAVGGASILLLCLWRVLDLDLTSPGALARFYFINFLLNAPHFMASYKLLYGSRERVRTYPGVAFFVPAFLLLFIIIGLVLYRQNRVFLEAVFGASVISLSWHYTAQTWGMMASFAFLENTPFARRERLLIRTNLWTIAAFHVVWAVVVMRRMFEPRAGMAAAEPLLSAATAQGLYHTVGVIALASGALGLLGLVLLGLRTRRVPAARVIIPWAAVQFWYVFLFREPSEGALFWVQNVHALQYFIFPWRVELNRMARSGAARGYTAMTVRSLLYYAMVVGAGLLLMGGLPWLAKNYGSSIGLVGLPLSLTVLSFFNLHHYFIDGVIWKIRNPVVRRDLFGHLSPTI